MKKIYLSLAIAIANFSYAQSVVGFEDFNLAPNSAWDGSDLTGVPNADSSVYDTTFNFAGLVLTNQWTNGNFSYWSGGWAFSNKTADTTTGLAGAYNSYAGGGDNSSNYVVAFTGSGGQEMSFAAGETAVFNSISVTNNSYAAHSMLMGDAYAKKFGGATGDDPDWFLLSIVGYDVNGSAVDTINFYLADYRFSDNSQDYIVKDWTTVDLSSLGAVNKIKFIQSSSDVGNFGMNTPAYVVVDNVSFSNYTSVNEIAEQGKLSVYPNPASSVLNINTNLNEGSIAIYNLAGQQVYSNTLNGLGRSIDVAHLTNGIYTVRIENNNNVLISKFIKQ